MISLAIAFSIVIGSIALYVGYLGLKQHQLAKRMQDVERQSGHHAQAERGPARAA